MAALPANLHQLSLEENPWSCDCRLLSLKRWLLATRTPLSAPVKCHSIGGQDRRAARELDRPVERRRRLPANGGAGGGQLATLNEMAAVDTSGGEDWTQGRGAGGGSLLLGQLALEEFVCAPRAAEGAPTLAAVYAYLEPLLVRPAQARASIRAGANATRAAQPELQQARLQVEAREGKWRSNGTSGRATTRRLT